MLTYIVTVNGFRILDGDDVVYIYGRSEDEITLAELTDMAEDKLKEMNGESI